MSASKIILINKSASEKKYGKANWKKIDAALGRLITADKKRGVDSIVYSIDSKSQMTKVGGKPVTKADSPSQVKRAIDAIFKALQPHYLMILGAPDLIPHVKLRNPIGGHEKDEAWVPSDLPYACDAGYSLSIERFIGPTRVLSRLPDVRGQSDPVYLVKLLDVAAQWKSSSRQAYAKSYFGVSAKVWKGSSRKNVSKLFGTTKKLQLVPPKDPPWSKSELKPLMHFINCHGASTNSRFYGEADGDFPEALWSNQLAGKVSPGAVIAAECCFGAQLYEPTSFEPNMGIANRYLGESSYGYLGSTNVAWGSSSHVTLADKVCQFFLQNVLNGASLGRAILQARQEFVSQSAPMGPHSLKTLAQFTLLGDPSIHPVKRSPSAIEAIVEDTANVGNEIMSHAMPDADLNELFQKKGVKEKAVVSRSQRRLSLFRQGLSLARKIATAKEAPVKVLRKALKDQFKAACREHGFRSIPGFTAYVVDEAVDHLKAKTKKDITKAAGGTRFLLAVEDSVEAGMDVASDAVLGFIGDAVDTLLASKNLIKGGTKRRPSKIIKRRMLVAVEKNGKIESYQEYHSR